MSLKSATTVADILRMKLERSVSRCECVLCQRSRRIHSICRKLPKEDAEWLLGFHNAVVDSECEQDMQDASVLFKDQIVASRRKTI